MTIQEFLNALNSWGFAAPKDHNGKTFLMIKDGSGTGYFINNVTIKDANGEFVMDNGKKTYKWMLGQKMASREELVTPISTINDSSEVKPF